MLIVTLTFLLLLAIVMFSIALGVVVLRAHERKKVRGFLAQLDERPQAVKSPLVVRAAGSASLLNDVLRRLGLGRKLELMLLQSGTGTRPGQLILSSLLLMAAGAGLGFLLRPWIAEPLASLMLGAPGLLPWLRVRR